MAANGKGGVFGFSTMTIGVLISTALIPLSCKPAEKNAAPATQPHDDPAKQRHPATTRPGALGDPTTIDTRPATAPQPTSRPTSRPPRVTRVRFIRLKHGGRGWDKNMGLGYDYNLLLKFKKVTGFKIADNTEYKEPARLVRFRKGKAPPFVFITGRGEIPLSAKEMKILRDYCLIEGGMLIGDSAGGHFDRSFRAMCKKLFPDKKLVEVPDDDVIHTEPFQFPNGAPEFWHQTRSKSYGPHGIKHKGRWVVYYHPGAMGAIWKTGHSGVSKGVADRAYKLGINLMYYSFTQYLKKHHPEPTSRPASRPAGAKE